MENLEPSDLEPIFEGGGLCATRFVAQIARDEIASPDEAGVGGENHIRQRRARLEQSDFHIQVVFQESVQGPPLLLGGLRVALAAPAGSRVLMPGTVVEGRAHQESHHRISSSSLVLYD